jgi:hypothetical protein
MILDLHGEVESLFRTKLLEFLAWAEAEWKITERDLTRDDWFEGKSPDYIEGYNAAIEGLKGAFECWNEEFGP